MQVGSRRSAKELRESQRMKGGLGAIQRSALDSAVRFLSLRTLRTFSVTGILQCFSLSNRQGHDTDDTTPISDGLITVIRLEHCPYSLGCLLTEVVSFFSSAQ